MLGKYFIVQIYGLFSCWNRINDNPIDQIHIVNLAKRLIVSSFMEIGCFSLHSLSLILHPQVLRIHSLALNFRHFFQWKTPELHQLKSNLNIYAHNRERKGEKNQLWTEWSLFISKIQYIISYRKKFTLPWKPK